MQYSNTSAITGTSGKPLRNPLRAVGREEDDLGMEARPVLPGATGEFEREEEGNGMGVKLVIGIVVLVVLVAAMYGMSRLLISFP